MIWPSSHVITSSHLATHLSQFCQTKGPASRSEGSSSIPSCNSLIRFAICFDVDELRRSSGVKVVALKNCSKRPFSNVPSSRGPIFCRASLCRICSSESLSIRCSTCGPYMRNNNLLRWLIQNSLLLPDTYVGNRLGVDPAFISSPGVLLRVVGGETT